MLKQRAGAARCLLSLPARLKCFLFCFFCLPPSVYFEPGLEICWKTKKPCVVTWQVYCAGVVGISAARPSGAAAQVIKTHLDSFYISADRGVRGKTLGDNSILAHYDMETPAETCLERKRRGK